VQSVHHAAADLAFLQRGREFPAQPEQGGLSLGLGTLGRPRTRSLIRPSLTLADLLLEPGVVLCDGSGSARRGQLAPKVS
jgi:hypothetical protein